MSLGCIPLTWSDTILLKVEMMTQEEIVRIIDEYTRAKGLENLAESVLETALFVESEFGVVFTDEELNTEHLGSPDRIVTTTTTKMRNP